MATYDVGSLTIEVDASSAKAASNIEVLTNVLKELRAVASSSGSALHTVKAALDKAGNVKLKGLNKVLSTIKANTEAIQGLSDALKSVGTAPKIPSPPKTTKQDYSSLAAEVEALSKQFSLLPVDAQKAATAMSKANAAKNALGQTNATPPLESVAGALKSLGVSAEGMINSVSASKEQVREFSTIYASLPPALQKAIQSGASAEKSFDGIGEAAKKAAQKANESAASFEKVRASVKAQKADYSGLAPEIQKVAQQWAVLPQNVQKAATAMASAKSAMDALSGNKLTVSANEAKAALDSLAAAAGRTAMGMNKKSIDTVAAAYASLPPAVQRAIKAQASLTKVNERTGLSFKSLKGAIAKVTVAYLAMRGISNAISGWITESNAYVENLNLFNVAMGEYADEAKRYADEVADVMGIDPSAWMRSQGVFMTLATGFGVAADKAAIMSTQLTQLGYDLSSFFNISVEDAMQKLQSGISGELEPLRRLGYDLSQARLQSIALANGIDKSVSSMSQAEKAQLRYYAIMTQVTEAQGDMARTLHAPANQLRILQAQLTQASRALGNVFIPMLNIALPYITAFVQVLRMAADALANLLGFKLPEVEYPGLDDVSTGATDATDALNAATGAAKELKGQLAGFDEITLITQTETGGGGGGAGVDLGGDLGLPLQQYDFLGDAIEDKVAEITKAIKKFLPLIETVGKALLAAFAGNALLKGLQKLSTAMGWKGLTGILGAAKTALLGFTAGFVPGAILTYTSAIIDAKDGTLDWSGAVAALTSVIGIAMTVIGGLTGKLGLAAAGIGVVVGAIVGMEAAQKQLRQEMIDAVVFDGQGIAISALADSYVKWMDAIIAAKQPILENKESIEASRESIVRTADDINMLSFAVENGVTSVEDAVPQFRGAFESLESETQNVLSRIADNITRSLAGATGDALVQMGWSLDEAGDIINRILGNQTSQLDALAKEREDLLAKMETSGSITNDELKRLVEISEQLKNLGGAYSDELAGFKNILTEITNADLDFTSMEVASEKFELIGSKTSEASEAIRAASDEIISSYEYMLQAATEAGDMEGIALFETLIDIEWGTREDQLAEIDREIDSFMQTVVSNMMGTTESIVAEATEKWNMMDVITQNWAYGGQESKFIEEFVQQFEDETLTPILTKMGESFGKDTTWATEAAGKLSDNLFTAVETISENKHEATAKVLVDDVTGAIDTAISEAMQSVGKDAVDGLAFGITDNVSIAADAMKAALTDGNSSVFAAAQEANQSHSPSKLYAAEGLNMMEGLADGITDNKNTPISALRGVLDELKRITDDAMRSLVNSVNATLREISASAASASATVSSSARVSVKGYAAGGFPTTGQMFLARESGPELVGTIGNRAAVANNDQIVSSVAEGVASANEEQNALLRQQNEILMALLDKEWSIGGEPNASFGRFASRSIDRYAAMAGRA